MRSWTLRSLGTRNMSVAAAAGEPIGPAADAAAHRLSQTERSGPGHAGGQERGSGSACLAVVAPLLNPTYDPDSSASVCVVPRRLGYAGFAAHGFRSDFGSDSRSSSVAFDPCDQPTASASVYPDPSAGTVATALTQIPGACAGGLPRLWRVPGCPAHA